jgi:hypothetical protein
MGKERGTSENMEARDSGERLDFLIVCTKSKSVQLCQRVVVKERVILMVVKS